MKRFNQQIEDAYVGSRRQGDRMRDPEIERSSGQDRRNRYREDKDQVPVLHPFKGDYRTDIQYANAADVAGPLEANDSDGYFHEHRERSGRYPDTYRSQMSGYMSTHVGADRSRQDYSYIQHGGTSTDHRGKGPRAYKRSDDRILDDLNDRLCDNPYLDASNIETGVKDCEVLLTGEVESREQKRLAEDIADNISGVTNVENRLRVKIRGI